MFNYKTNRIINGICEFCGIKAENCEHYMDGRQTLPTDEAVRLTKPYYVPRSTVPVREVVPLTDEEKAKNLENAKKAWSGETQTEQPAQSGVSAPDTTMPEQPPAAPVPAADPVVAAPPAPVASPEEEVTVAPGSPDEDIKPEDDVPPDAQLLTPKDV